MINIILVPASGSSTDDSVFATALAAAQPSRPLTWIFITSDSRRAKPP